MPPNKIIALMPEAEELLQNINSDQESNRKRFASESEKELKDARNETDEAKYQKRKMLASGMMDLALLSANANQLRHILETPQHSFFYLSLGLVASSLIIQVTVGVLLIINTNYSIVGKGETRCRCANILNNLITGGVLLISAINVFISAFGVSVSSGSFSDSNNNRSQI